MTRRLPPFAVLCTTVVFALSAVALGQEQASRVQASHYHFIADFSRDQLVVTEMLARPGTQAPFAGAGGERLQMALPSGALGFQAGPGVGLVGGEVVIDFAEAGDGQYLTWKYLLPIHPGTMTIERTLPLSVAVASVIVQDAGPELDVAWPRAAEVRPSISRTEGHLTASARTLPADEPVTVALLGVPGPTEPGSRTWLLWVVAAMATATVGAVIAGPRRR